MNETDDTTVALVAVREALGMQPLVCKTCRRVVGYHTDTVLHLQHVHFITPVVLYCNVCSTRIRWRPIPQAIDKEK